MPDLPYTYTDPDTGAVLTVDTDGDIQIAVGDSGHYCSLPPGAEFIRAILAAPGDTGHWVDDDAATEEPFPRIRQRVQEWLEDAATATQVERDRFTLLEHVDRLTRESQDRPDIHVATPEGITPCGQGHQDVPVTALIREATCLGCLRTLAQANHGDLPEEDLVEPGDEVPTLCELADRVAALEERLSPPEKQGVAAPAPARYRDNSGDLWEQTGTDRYDLVEWNDGDPVIRGVVLHRTLDHLQRGYGPLTLVTDETTGGGG